MTAAAMDDSMSDFAKILSALGGLGAIGSVQDVLEVVGLADMPMAQRYGIMFGCIVFFLTVSTVIALLTFGGSFKRVQEQAQTGQATVSDAVTARQGRPLLLERLIEAQERMMKKYPNRYTKRTADPTPLTNMLLTVAPKMGDVAELIDEQTGDKKPDAQRKVATCIPEGYQDNYVYAYRRCQDQPGGEILSGVPESRFEAYARAYAGCGIYTTPSYRRSYSRMYEAISCANHSSEKNYSQLYTSRPHDIHGRTVRLEALSVDSHAKNLHSVTCGEAYENQKRYNPQKIWGFLECGPFKRKEDLINSSVFQLKDNQAGFAILSALTDQIIGVIHLTNDDPKNLSIQMELPIVKPSAEGTVEQLEACFLLLDRLFAHGYRRIQLCFDSQDTISKKVPGRLGFTQEGLLPKHRIAKESSMDNIIYGMLNSDWDKGARAYLYIKLHGADAQKVDAQNEKREAELEHQQHVLKEKELLKKKK